MCAARAGDMLLAQSQKSGEEYWVSKSLFGDLEGTLEEAFRTRGGDPLPFFQMLRDALRPKGVKLNEWTVV